MASFVEIDRARIINMGGSPYVLLPKNLRRKLNPEFGEEVVFCEDADTGDIHIRVDHRETKKAS